MERYDHEKILEGLEKDIRPDESLGNVEFVDVTEEFKKARCDFVAGTRIWLCKRIKPEEYIGRIEFKDENKEYKYKQNSEIWTETSEVFRIANFLWDIEAKLSDHVHKMIRGGR